MKCALRVKYALHIAVEITKSGGFLTVAVFVFLNPSPTSWELPLSKGRLGLLPLIRDELPAKKLLLFLRDELPVKKSIDNAF